MFWPTSWIDLEFGLGCARSSLRRDVPSYHYHIPPPFCAALDRERKLFLIRSIFIESSNFLVILNLNPVLPDQIWDKLISVHLKGTYKVVHAAWPHTNNEITKFNHNFIYNGNRINLLVASTCQCMYTCTLFLTTIHHHYSTCIRKK